ncbi:hypothetical protein [Mesorhizobium sp. M0618]|uniref:hypothetical protein n=1 Tax=unclassified Mesorhizobium TaxID=325217 RepID=UPI00333655F8
MPSSAPDSRAEARYRGLASLIIGIVTKARQEESFLHDELGSAYDDYIRRVPMLVPFAPV